MSEFHLTLSIGDLYVKIEGQNSAFLQTLKNKYQPFIVQIHNNVITNIRIEEEVYEERFDEIILRKNNDHYLLQSEDFKARICLNTKNVMLRSRLEITVFDAFLRILYSLLIVYHNGFLVHSAGIKYRENGYIFIGPSSSGKTTTARLAHGSEVLNDELTLVRIIDENVFVYATPFVGEYHKKIFNNHALLRYLCFLNKELMTSHKKQDRLHNLINLMENVFFFDNDISANDLLLATCKKITDILEGYQVNILVAPSIEEVIHGIHREGILSKSANCLAEN